MSDKVEQPRGFAGQRVLITAGAGGIGLAIAQRMISDGAKVMICDVDDLRLKEFKGLFPEAYALKADVSDTQSVEALVSYTQDKLGGLDALINNAGIAGPTGGVEDIDPIEWKRCLDICLTGQFLCAHFAVPLIKASGGGSIVNMSSVAGKHGYAFRTPYSSAKFGVIGFTQSLAKELGPDNIRVNAILPGIVEGPRMEGVIRDRADQLGLPYEEMEAEYLAKISLRRMVTAQDVAGTIAFLLSAEGANISGQSLAVDGNVETL